MSEKTGDGRWSLAKTGSSNCGREDYHCELKRLAND
jgi:hypothetical protein